MQAEYRRDTHHSYLVLDQQEVKREESFQKRMFLENTIPGFLPCRMHAIDGSGQFYYEISSRQSLTNLLETKAMDRECMEKLLTSLVRALNGLQEYLLDTGGFCLKPEWIFMSPSGNAYEFCYYPGGKQDWKTQMGQLAEYLLPRLDHKSLSAVRLGYSFYQSVMEDRITAADLEQLLGLQEEGESHEPEERPQPVPIKVEREGNPEEITPVPASRDALLQAFFDPEETDEKETEPKEKSFLLLLELLLPLIVGGTGTFIFWFFGYDGAAFALLGLTVVIVVAVLYKRWRKQKEQEQDATMEQYVIVQDWLEEEKQEEKFLKEAAESGKGAEEMDEGATCLLTDAAVYSRLAKGYLVPDSSVEGQTFSIDQEVTMIGKSSQMDVVLKAMGISRIHARITCRGDNCFLTDLNSRNGTRLNGVLLKPEEEQLLADGDRISFANTGYEWRCYRL